MPGFLQGQTISGEENQNHVKLGSHISYSSHHRRNSRLWRRRWSSRRHRKSPLFRFPRASDRIRRGESNARKYPLKIILNHFPQTKIQ